MFSNMFITSTNVTIFDTIWSFFVTFFDTNLTNFVISASSMVEMMKNERKMGPSQKPFGQSITIIATITKTIIRFIFGFILFRCFLTQGGFAKWHTI